MRATIATTSMEQVAQWAAAHGEPAWLIDQRKAAWEAFRTLPLPPKTEEAWKYTDLARLPWERYALFAHDLCHLAPTPALAEGIIATDLATALRQYPDLVRPYVSDPALDAAAAALRPGFSGLNGGHYSGAKYLSLQEALWDRGVFIYVPAGTTVTVPLHTRCTLAGSGTAIFPRTIVVLGEGAQATVVDAYTSPDLQTPADALAHARVELHLQAGARLQYLNLQQWHRGVTHLYHQHATLARDSALTSVTVTLGSATTKAIVEAALTAPGATSTLFGLGFGDGTQHFDHHTLQTHLAPHTTSDLLYKMALKDRAASIYTGLIRMTKAAQKADAYQSNRNLLLSEAARATAVPQLEIEANDVRCTHGASVGTIDEEQRYYLMARGLSRHEAEQMVACGFFEELLARFPDEPLRAMVRTTINQKLGGNHGDLGEMRKGE